MGDTEVDDDRFIRAGMLISSAAIDDDADFREACRRALDLVHLDEGLDFAVFLCCSAAAMLVQAGQPDTPPAERGITTIQVLGADGQPKSIDDVDEPLRTTWRAVIAAANGESPVPFLLAADSVEASAEITVTLMELLSVAAKAVIGRG